MSTALALRPDAAALASLADETERAKVYAANARAKNTRLAYTRDFQGFAAWCKARALECLPATSATVALYLSSLADAGKRVSTIERALVSIGAVHRAAGHEWVKGQKPVPEVMAGIRRTLGSAPKKKTPVVDADLLAMLDTLDESLAGLRDRALLTLGWFAARRRSEIVALEVEDVRFVREGIELTIRRSKTDQEGRGAVIGVPYASDARACPVRSVKAWLEASNLTAGALFRSVDRHGNLGEDALSDRTVARVVKRTAETAGLDPSRFAGHSLRAGFATTAARKGKGLDAIMKQTGHKSERVARGYIRHATVFDDNAATGLL